MDKPPKSFCHVCARGSFPGKNKEHSLDNVSCRVGRLKWYQSLSNEDQMEKLKTYEVLSSKLATYIWDLSLARNKSPLEVMIEEGLSTL